MDAQEKVRENRLRRVLDRRGLALCKQRRIDPDAIDFGKYCIIDAKKNYVIVGAEHGWFSMSLDDVEDWAEENRRTKKKP